MDVGVFALRCGGEGLYPDAPALPHMAPGGAGGAGGLGGAGVGM